MVTALERNENGNLIRLQKRCGDLGGTKTLIKASRKEFKWKSDSVQGWLMSEKHLESPSASRKIFRIIDKMLLLKVSTCQSDSVNSFIFILKIESKVKIVEKTNWNKDNMKKMSSNQMIYISKIYPFYRFTNDWHFKRVRFM